MAAVPTDLLRLTADLVAMPSESFEEAAITDWLEAQMRACSHLTVARVGDNLVARTDLGRDHRLILGGHTDTVVANGNAEARIDGDTLWGLGSTDMKAGVAIMLELARSVAEPVIDVTYVFYAREEVSIAHNGLRELFTAVPELLIGDVAILGEPTGGTIEAGCQGTMRAEVVLRGARAHTARPWMGRNAIHRLGALLEALAAYRAATTGGRRLRVPRGAPGGGDPRGSGRQRGARRGVGDGEPPIRPRPDAGGSHRPSAVGGDAVPGGR